MAHRVIRFVVEGESSSRVYTDPQDFKIDGSYVYVKDAAGINESYVPLFLLSTAVKIETS